MPTLSTEPKPTGLKPITLATPLTTVLPKLVTPAFAGKLRDGLQLATLGDALQHYPRRYEDRTYFKPMAEVKHGETVTLTGQVVRVENNPTRTKLMITRVTLRDESGICALVFFNQWFLKKQFEKLTGARIIAFGRASRSPMRGLELSEVEWEMVDEEGGSESLNSNRIVPVYPLAEGVKQERMRRIVWEALALVRDNSDLAADALPVDLRERHHLLSQSETLRQIHYPDNGSKLDDARYRLTFEEFLAVQLLLVQQKRAGKNERGIAVTERVAEAAVSELAAALPFQMTDAQQRVIGEIAADMREPRPMNRLVQGDVGSGKTVVAMAAMLMAVRSGYQAALMAPTEILAEQHAAGVRRVMQALNIPVALVTGSSHTAREKADILQCIANGQYPIVIGTHALIQESIRFHKLGLAVVDEQHRFGVVQRATLRDKGLESSGITPDVLVMTATPIPRTLTLTVYGDLDVSVVDALPPGRKPIRTHWKKSDERGLVYDTMRKLLQQGRQAYVICPLVEESDKLQVKAATELAEELATEVFPEFRVGLLHGQMKSSEKDAAMQAFRSRELDILVSTTVIEVGVDVPNSSVIVIEDADRFGLAQLHQLRGRVGRGDTQSYCLLISDPKTPDGAARMTIMAESTDGFKIAEEDLRLRGPGDFYGTRQSGAVMLPFIDVLRDAPILQEARAEAFEIIEQDSTLKLPQNAGLRALVAQRRRQIASLGGAN